MTSLFVVHDAPYPPRSGSPLRSWQNISLLAEFGPVHVFSVGIKAPDATMPKAASWTHVDASDYPVRSAEVPARILRALRPREFPIEDDYASNRLNRLLNQFVASTAPDLIVVSHWHTALPRALRGRHVLVADTHNVESDLMRHLARDARGTLSLRERMQHAQWRRRERAYLKGVDRIWATCEVDAHAFRSLAGTLPPIDIVPNAVDVPAYDDVARRRAARIGRGATIGYIGYFGYEPNADAARALVERVFPAVAERVLAARLLLVGKAPTEAMRRAAQADARIVVTGEVEDVRRYLRDIDVLAVPLSTGSGTRLKILEAFASRIPVVTTAKGAEGLAVVAGEHLEICDVPEMAGRCIALLGDAARTRRLTDAAHRLVQERYSWSALARNMPAMLESLMNHGTGNGT